MLSQFSPQSFSQPRPGGLADSLLAQAEDFPALVVLLCTDEAVYLSGPASLWKIDLKGAKLQHLAAVPLPWRYRQAARWRRLRRLDLREIIQLPTGVLLSISRKQILALNPDSGEMQSVFQVSDGGRPRGLAQARSGHLLVGEDWGNPRRLALRTWGSADGGDTWEIAHTLPAGSAKHIHNIIWDEHRQGLWVLTGDGDSECALLFTADEFKTVNEVVRGGQMARACELFCQPEGLYYGIDTERAPNWFVHLEVNTGQIHKLQPLPGSCLYAACLADRYWLSTAVEPTKVNHERRPALWTSPDLHRWTKVVEFDKDRWPGQSLGFGRVMLPRVQGGFPWLVFSAVAVKQHDLTTFVVKPEALAQTLSAGDR